MGSAYDVVVVGAGIVGLASAYRLLEADPGLRLAVLDKEGQVGAHQSSHNSGVLHAGVYYAPGSLKAQLCRAGKAAAEAFAAAHGIPVERNGKLVVAVDEAELARFTALAERARANGVEGLREIGAAEIREIEPAARGIRALHSPATAVVDFAALCRALAEEVRARGGDVVLGAEALGIAEGRAQGFVTTTRGEFLGRAVLVCGGLQADRLARLSELARDVRTVPFRGSWLALRPEAARLCQGSIYPVPDPRFPFLGVHLTRRVDGQVWVGPNAVLAGAREAYARGRASLPDLAAALGWPGLWRLGRRYWRTGAAELWADRVRTSYLRQVRRYVPDIGADDVVARPTGVRAQAVLRDGTLADDFLVEGTRRVVHVLNAPSPAATASLAIGEHLRREVLARLG